MHVAGTASQVGRLANLVAEADAELLALQSEVALRREETNKALIHAASFRQGSTIGSVSAFLDSDSPPDLLVRAELLDAVGDSRLDGLERMQRARTQSANKSARARAALEFAHSAEQRAAAAKAAADSAYLAAIAAEAAQARGADVLRARKSGLDRRFAAAQYAVTGLSGQRQRYAEWSARRDREPVAVTAESGAGELAHYSGAQYHAGRKVPLAGKRPGDMLFWGSSGRIHHVALYLGNEQMIEAPYSGSAVRISSVRYDGIMSYAARLLRSLSLHSRHTGAAVWSAWTPGSVVPGCAAADAV